LQDGEWKWGQNRSRFYGAHLEGWESLAMTGWRAIRANPTHVPLLHCHAGKIHNADQTSPCT
jgi:hypothetical protein